MRLLATTLVLAALALAWTNPGTPLFSGNEAVTFAVDTTGTPRWLITDPLGRLLIGGTVTIQSTTLLPAMDTLYCANGVVDTLVFAEPAATISIQNADAANDLYFSFDASTYATIFPKGGFSMANVRLDTLFLTASAGGTLAEVVTQIYQ